MQQMKLNLAGREVINSRHHHISVQGFGKTNSNKIPTNHSLDKTLVEGTPVGRHFGIRTNNSHVEPSNKQIVPVG